MPGLTGVRRRPLQPRRVVILRKGSTPVPDRLSLGTTHLPVRDSSLEFQIYRRNLDSFFSSIPAGGQRPHPAPLAVVTEGQCC